MFYKLRVFISVTLIIILICLQPTMSATEDFYFAVSPLVGDEDFFMEQFNAKPPRINLKYEEKLETKNEICEAVIGSTLFFNAHGVIYIDPNLKKIQDKLKENQTDIYSRHYVMEGGLSKFTNPYNLREISGFQTPLREFVFTCLAWNRASKTIAEYFVSREYNLNYKDVNGSRQKGRFIFGNNKNKEISVIAIAEEPAHVEGYEVSSLKEFESQKMNKFDAMTKDSRSRTLCDLKSVQKIRLCTLVLSSKRYRLDVNFSPSSKNNNVDPACELRKAQFSYMEKDCYFYEYMIQCKFKSHAANVFYVSLGSDHNQFFVFKGSNASVASSALDGHFVSSFLNQIRIGSVKVSV